MVLNKHNRLYVREKERCLAIRIAGEVSGARFKLLEMVVVNNRFHTDVNIWSIASIGLDSIVVFHYYSMSLFRRTHPSVDVRNTKLALRLYYNLASVCRYRQNSRPGGRHEGSDQHLNNPVHPHGTFSFNPVKLNSETWKRFVL